MTGSGLEKNLNDMVVLEVIIIEMVLGPSMIFSFDASVVYHGTLYYFISKIKHESSFTAKTTVLAKKKNVLRKTGEGGDV